CAANGGLACNGTGQVCEADHSCCTQEPLTTTCSGAAGDDCGTSVPNNCGVTVSCPTTCASDFTCGGNPATPTKCTCSPGAVRCVGLTPQTCDPAGLTWQSGTVCATACINGIGCGTCVPTHTQCSDSRHVQTCQANGTFDSGTQCPADNPVCIT